MSECVSDEAAVGKHQYFAERGDIYYRWGEPKAHPLGGAIWNYWGANGRETGKFGYASSDQQTFWFNGGGTADRQHFGTTAGSSSSEVL